jgi:hypothetical protein
VLWQRGAPDTGQIWSFLAFCFVADQLRWLELRRRWSGAPGLSLNKASFFFFWRLPLLALLRGVSWFVQPSRWWFGGGGPVGEISFSQRLQIRSCLTVLLLLLPLVGLGGGRRVWSPALSCSKGDAWGILQVAELKHAVGFFIAIYYRHGDSSSTSGVEAFTRSGHGSSKPAHHVVICSPWRAGGPWLRLVVGRRLPSYRPLFLGGDALRTLARGGGGALGLDFLVSVSSRVLYVKKIGLFFR